MKTVENWGVEEIRMKEVNKSRAKLDGRCMFPSTHDITESNLKYCLITLKNLLSAGNDVLIVSKPKLKVVRALCKELEPYKKQILFRFTIGSYKQAVLSYWEPNAPSFKQRFNSLKYAFENGFETSISCEPCLSPDIRPLITMLLPYVTDTIWIGKPNLFVQRLSINGYKDAETVAKARKLLSELSDEWSYSLYQDYKRNRKIMWKESMMKVLGLMPQSK